MRRHSLRLTTKYVHAHVREETERPDSLSRFFFFLFLFSNPRPFVDAPEAIPVSRSPRMQQEIDLLSLSGSYGGVVVAAGSCYRPQVRYADKQTMTNPLPKPPPPSPPPCLAAGPLKTEICQWFQRLPAYLGFLWIPKQPGDKTGGRERGGAWGSGRGSVLRQSYPRWNEHRCNFSQDKGPLCFWRNATVFCCCDATRMRKELQKQSGKGTESMGSVRTGPGGGG